MSPLSPVDKGRDGYLFRSTLSEFYVGLFKFNLYAHDFPNPTPMTLLEKNPEPSLKRDTQYQPR